MIKPIKVLQIQPKYSVQTSDPKEEIINALATDQFDVTAAFLTGTAEQSKIPTHCKKVKCFEFSKKQLKGLRITAIFQLWKYCREQQFDVIITHRFKPLYIVLIVNKLLSKPAQCISVIRANGEFERSYRRRLTHFFVDKHWKFVGVSESVKEDLIQSPDAGLTEKNVTYINNALDLNRTLSGLLTKTSAREQLKLDNNDFVFGTIGRLVTIKGHFCLLDAFKQVLAKHPSAKLVIIGGGQLEKKMHDYLQANDLQSSVILTGNIADAYRLLSAFDIFTLTSTTEAFGIVLLEAMIAKLPIIATDVGGIKYVISDKGILIPPADVDALSAAMQEYIQLSKLQLQSLGEELYQRAEENFTIEQYRNNFLHLVTDFHQQRT